VRSEHRILGEEGSLLLAVMIGAAIATIALATASQAWSTVWRRDSEEELIFRAEQYVSAILAYRKEHGGDFPKSLEDLYKPGPRRLRYIRQLYRDPIAEDGKWGLLYLMPTGRGVYDPKAAQRAKGKGGGWGQDWVTAGTTPIADDQAQLGTGNPGTGGMIPGSPPAGMPPIPPPLGDAMGGGLSDEESVSETPLGWPIVGVISRATGDRAENTFMVRKGHDRVDEWQFHVFERAGVEQPTANTSSGQPSPNSGCVGPSYGGKCLGGGPVPDPNMFPKGGSRGGQKGQRTPGG